MQVRIVYRVFVVFKRRVKPTDVQCLRITFQKPEEGALYTSLGFLGCADLWLDCRTGRVFEESWANHEPLIMGQMSVIEVSDRCVDFWTMDGHKATFVSRGLRSLVERGLSPQSEHWQAALSDLMAEYDAREVGRVRAN